MARYIARRLLLAIPVLIGASFLIFAMVFALPGDPIRALGGDRPISEAVQAQLRDEYNLDDPLMVQYGKYVAGLAQGDLGTDFSGRPVADILETTVPITVKLALVALAFEAVFGLIAGVLAGIRQKSFFDSLVLVTTTLIVSIPIFVLGFLAQYVLGLRLGIFPIAGIANGFEGYLLPGFVLASLSLAYVARLTRTSLVENLRNDYVRTAKAKGLKPGGDVPRRRPRRADVRRGRHRGHLQHPRPRSRGVPGDPEPGGQRRRRHRDAVRLRLHRLQPPGRRHVRGPRPSDPL
jgi:peptide/nickel transport system permease protein/oligopeptide transport system permease protein